MLKGGGVALGGGDGQSEQVADAADVAAAGVGLVQDAVLADGLDAAGHAGLQLDPPVADGAEAGARSAGR